MQVGIDATCMHTNFGGHGLSCFGDKISFQFCKSYNDVTMDGVFKQSVSHVEMFFLFSLNTKITMND